MDKEMNKALFLAAILKLHEKLDVIVEAEDDSPAEKRRKITHLVYDFYDYLAYDELLEASKRVGKFG